MVFQTSLFVSMCFRYEKLKTNFVSCLERSESASKQESNCLSADKTKLHTEIQDLQVQRIEISMCFLVGDDIVIMNSTHIHLNRSNILV